MLLLLGALVTSSLGAPAARRLNLVIITLDTLRADRVSAYGYQRPTTPSLDQLARQGVLFERAYTQVPKTLPSHASMFTGRYPASLPCLQNWTPMPESALTLAEMLRERGYHTAAFVSAAVLVGELNANQGFQLFSDDLSVPLPERALVHLPYGGPSAVQTAVQWATEVSAATTVSRALSWLQAKRREPFFLWVHLWSPHGPYLPPEPYRRKFSTDKQGLLAQLNALYDGEVAYADAELGRLLHALRPLRKRTLICVLGDHGEGLGHKRYLQHAEFVYEPELRIPLVMAGPGLPRAKRIPSLAQTVDLLPTILDFLQQPLPQGVQGKSLMPVIRGETTRVNDFACGQRGSTAAPLARLWLEGPPLPLAAEQSFIVVDRAGPNKLILSDGSQELFNLKDDPQESRNLASQPENRALLNELTTQLHQSEREWTEQAAPPEPTKAISPELEQRLRALGYIR